MPPSTRRGPHLTRRSFLVAAGVLGISAVAAQHLVFAEENGLVDRVRRDAATSRIDVKALRGNVSAIEGSGGNIAVLPGPDGALLVDAGFPVARERIRAALARIGALPVRHLVNTHWHFDHTDGNEWLHAAGASIVAHENTRRHMSTTTRVDDWDHTFPPAPAGALPEVVFTDSADLQLNGETIALQHYGPAHTDSDISVRFLEADVLHVGDTWWDREFPFIDHSTGGSIDGAIRAAEANVAAVGDETVVIPGHGEVGGRRGLVEFRDMLVTVRGEVAALKRQGRSRSEVVALRPTAPYDSAWGGGLISGPAFAELVYEGV